MSTTTPELSPATLAAFCRGDEDGIRTVYQSHSGPVFAVAYSVLRDRELAADVVQETFLRAWRASATYDLGYDLAPWLYTIARRVAIDLWRRLRRTADHHPIQDGDVIALPPELDAMWEAHQVRHAVDRLPVEERAIVHMQHFDQLSHAEIAAQSGVPIGTVKSRSFRAHRRLAGWLSPLLADEDPAKEPQGEAQR